MPKPIHRKGLQYTSSPAILVSSVFLSQWLSRRGDKWWRSWALDSGAYSALGKGTQIDIVKYTDTAASLLDTDPSLKTVFALDVIGDPEASIRNTEYMWSQGVKAVPTFHHGSPWHYLDYIKDHYEKVAAGGLVARRGKGTDGIYTPKLVLCTRDRVRFLDKFFAIVWPKWVHGFGCTTLELLYRYPFASVDSTSWFYKVRQFGIIHGYRGLPSPRVTKSRLGAEAATRCSLRKFIEVEGNVRDRFGKFVCKVSDVPFTLNYATMASVEELSTLRGSVDPKPVDAL